MNYLSFLYPNADSVHLPHGRINSQTEKDLAMETVYNAFTGGTKFNPYVEQVLSKLHLDVETIAHRQSFFKDLESIPELLGQLEQVDNLLRIFSHRAWTMKTREHQNKKKNGLYSAINRLSELETYAKCIQLFSQISGRPENDSLKTLIAFSQKQLAQPHFKNLIEKLPQLRASIRNCSSISLGLNLDDDLFPVEATILSINSYRYSDGSQGGLLSKLMGQSKYSGITQLHSPPIKQMRSGDFAASLDPQVSGYEVHPTMVPLFKDLSEVLEKSAKKLESSLTEFARIETWFVLSIAEELPFLIQAWKGIEELKKYYPEIPWVLPEICQPEDTVFEMEQGYNLHLMLSRLQSRKRGSEEDVHELVGNNAFLNTEQQWQILTGPNQGGKTVYLQSIGIVQILAQAGFPVPAFKAKVSPIHHLATHYQVEERPDEEKGRLGEESSRLKGCIIQLQKGDMLLMNESFSSTNHGEGVYIAKEVLRFLLEQGIRGVMATHLYELAEKKDQIHEDLHERVVNMRAAVDENKRRTFKIEPGSAALGSYALEIARKHGLSYDQLRAEDYLL
jgi:DNA mismatch repair protein MutS